ncbi:MAG: Do family serine endopeptidase [Bacteroidota bacterium]|nr:Do family serine endopeptidase [Bacteroidota bacterium]
MKKTITVFFTALLGGFIAFYTNASANVICTPERNSEAMMSSASSPVSPGGQLPDMTFAAEKSVHAVVHIQVETQVEEGPRMNNPFDFLFGDPFEGQRQEPQIRKGSGSGVIISTDGYIVTNNHVVDEAKKIKVILNDKREFEAKVVGSDANTDIALIKINAKDLPFLTFGNSDDMKVGEWVLAVGNPFNLTSTVTAGIVSAKSRSIGIQQGKMPIESFIQTDAAVNPGNSGGALVNLKGELIGINAAIASPTGAYSGYSFAIPTSIVQKVVADMRKYGQVKRAILGVKMQTVDADLAKEKDLDKIEGVYVDSVTEDGAAKSAGIKSGDVITSINKVAVNSNTQLAEQIGRYHPGDKIELEVKREGKVKLFSVTLRNNDEDSKVGSNIEFLGSKLREATFEEKNAVDITNGVKVLEVGKGMLKDAGIREGFIITDVNKTSIRTTKDIISVVKSSKGGVLIEGVYPNGEVAVYAFNMKN